MQKTKIYLNKPDELEKSITLDHNKKIIDQHPMEKGLLLGYVVTNKFIVVRRHIQLVKDGELFSLRSRVRRIENL